MINCVCMNPAMDRTVELDGFAYGGLNRVQRSIMDATGKAVNVAIVLSRLGEQVRLTGVNYREGGKAVCDRLTAEGVDGDFIWLAGSLRVNLKALDMRTGVMTEINDAGAPMPPEAAREALELIHKRSVGCDYVALCGSLPTGVSAGFYRSAIENGPEGARFVLDCDGERLTEGIKARPFLIKPNRYELGLLFGRELRDGGEVLACAREIARQGVKWVVVSLGSEGAMIAGEDEAWYASSLDVPVSSTVGAGDSMVAGLLHGFAMGGDAAQALRWGVACGNASVMTEGTSLIDNDALPTLLSKVKCEKIAM